MNLGTPINELCFQAKDPKFDIDQIQHYSLCLQYSNNEFEFCIIDNHDNKCLFLERHELKNCYTLEQRIELLDKIFDDHHLLQVGFWHTIKLSLKSSKFSLIPKSLFEKNQLHKYLSFNCSINPENEVLLYNNQKSIDAVNIFSTEQKLFDWFKSKYPNKEINIMHETCPFIEGVFHENAELQESRQAFIYLEKDHFQIIVTSNKQLEYSNIFYHSTPDDLAYYVMYVFNELSLNPETTPTTLWGEINEASPEYHKLYKYINLLYLGDRPHNLQFSFHFDEVEDQKFFSLYNMHLCE